MTLLAVFLIGFFAGLRSLTAPAATAWAVYLKWFKLDYPLAYIGSFAWVAILSALAAIELIADKLPQTPSRTAPPGLIARIVTGGFTGACIAAGAGQANFSRRRARRCGRRCRLFRRLPCTQMDRENARYARHLRRPNRGSRGDRGFDVGRVAILSYLCAVTIGRALATSCEHLQGLTSKDFPSQKTPNACEECLSEGTVLVALPECQACSHVGCCDSSTGNMRPNIPRDPASGDARGPAGGLDVVLCP